MPRSWADRSRSRRKAEGRARRLDQLGAPGSGKLGSNRKVAVSLKGRGYGDFRHPHQIGLAGDRDTIGGGGFNRVEDLNRPAFVVAVEQVASTRH